MSSASRFGALRAILFDLDGTLVDTLDDLAASVNHALSLVGRPVRTREEIRSFIGEGVRSLLRDSLGPGNESLTDMALAIFTPHYLDHCTDNSVLYPGVLETLEKLSRTWALGVVTNKPDAPSRKIFERLGILGRFKVLIAGDTLKVKKPDPAPVLEAARRLGFPPGQTVLVGDSAGDVTAAHGAGALAVGAAFGFRPRTELKGAEAVVERFSDLLKVLEA